MLYNLLAILSKPLGYVTLYPFVFLLLSPILPNKDLCGLCFPILTQKWKKPALKCILSGLCPSPQVVIFSVETSVVAVGWGPKSQQQIMLECRKFKESKPHRENQILSHHWWRKFKSMRAVVNHRNLQKGANFPKGEALRNSRYYAAQGIL